MSLCDLRIQVCITFSDPLARRIAAMLKYTITRKLVRTRCHVVGSKLSSSHLWPLFSARPDREHPPHGLPRPAPFELGLHSILQPVKPPCVLGVFQFCLSVLIGRAAGCSLIFRVIPQLWRSGGRATAPPFFSLDTEAEDKEET